MGVGAPGRCGTGAHAAPPAGFGWVAAAATVCALLAAAGGCVQSGTCPGPATTPQAPRDIDPRRPFIGAGDPFAPGPLAVRTLGLAGGEHAAPAPLRIHAPEGPGPFAVVVFQHGFVTRNDSYDEILRHVASHGLLVVAPQMYPPGPAALLGRPTAAEETRCAAAVLDWLPGHLAGAAGVAVRCDLLGLAGHSRGAKVAWLVLAADHGRARAIAGVDPVDGRGGPLGNQPRVADRPLELPVPTLVIGTGRGGDCAPAGDNHEQFYAASAAPAWHIVAPESGHADMLDEDAAAAAVLVCPGGPDRAGTRRLAGGLLAAFFRAALQGDEAALAYLADPGAAPVPVEVEYK